MTFDAGKKLAGRSLVVDDPWPRVVSVPKQTEV